MTVCAHDTHDGACETCANTDEWVVPADLRPEAPVTMPPLSGDGGEKR